MTALLTSPKLPSLLALNSELLADNLQILKSFFTRHDITHIPSYAGLYVFAKMAKDAHSWEEEESSVQRLKEAGVLVSAGRGYHGPQSEMGWMRVGFAVEKSLLEEAVKRMDEVYINKASAT